MRATSLGVCAYLGPRLRWPRRYGLGRPKVCSRAQATCRPGALRAPGGILIHPTYAIAFALLVLAPSIPAAPTGDGVCRDDVYLFTYFWPYEGASYAPDGTVCGYFGAGSELQPRAIPPGTTSVGARYVAPSFISGGVRIEVQGLGLSGSFPTTGDAGSSTYLYTTEDLAIDADAAGEMLVRAYARTTGALLAEATYTAATGTPVYDHDCAGTHVFSRLEGQHTATIVDWGSEVCHMADPFLQPGAEELQVRSAVVDFCFSSQPHRVKLVGLGLDGTYTMPCSMPPVDPIPVVGGGSLPLAYYSAWIDIPEGASGSLDVTEYDHAGAIVDHIVYRTLDDWLLHAHE